MTVIAYKDGIMACDSRVADGDGHIYPREHKIKRTKAGALVGSAGDVDIRAVMALLERCKTPDQLPSAADLADTQCDFSCLIVFPRGDIWEVDVGWDDESDEWYASASEVVAKFAACGAGRKYAVVAMQLGKSAVEACAVACDNNNTCGRPLYEVPLKAPRRRRVR